MWSSFPLDFVSAMFAHVKLPSASIPIRITDKTASLLDNNIVSLLALVQNSIQMTDISDGY